MNPIRNVVPTETTRLRGRATRLAQLSTLFAAVLLGAINCGDSSTTDPLIWAGVNVAPDSLKHPAVPPGSEPAPSASLSASSARASAAGSAAADPSMTASSIPFAPAPGPFKSGGFPANDDFTWGGSVGFDIGFDFMFYGVTHKKFWIGSNGVVLFRRANGSAPQSDGACCFGWIPSSTDRNHNLIALAWTDLVPGGNQVTYETRGTAPDRRLIVNFASVPLYNGTGRVTTQAILYERTNVVEIHTTSQTGSQEFTQGVENATGSAAAFIAGRRFAKYTLANDAVRFTPVGQNAVPVVNAGGNAGGPPADRYEGLEGSAIAFNGSATDGDGDPLTYSWDFNRDGVADASTPSASYTYDDNGVYTATLTVSDGRGGVGQASVQVHVKNVNPKVEAGSDVRITAGRSVDFNGTFSDPGVNDRLWGWTWNLSPVTNHSGAVPEQVPVPDSHRFCKAGSFSAQFTVVDKDGGSGADEVAVTVDAIPVQIDINPSTINLNDNGHALVNVRAYSRPDLDVTSLNAASMVLTNGSGRGTTIARTGGGLLHWNADSDLNGDGLLDVEMKFRRDELIKNDDLQMNTTKLMLKGSIDEGLSATGECGDVLGSADVRVKVKAKNGSAAAPLNEETTP